MSHGSGIDTKALGLFLLYIITKRKLLVQHQTSSSQVEQNWTFLFVFLWLPYYSIIITAWLIQKEKKAGNNAKKVQYQLLSKTRFQHNDEMFHMKWVTNFSTFTLLWTWALDVNMCAASTQLLVISCLKIMGKIEGCYKHYADVYL